MSIKHAANRFRHTPVDGWDGTRWVPAVARVSFFSSDRLILATETPNKVRHALANPEEPLPPRYEVVRLPGNQIYLVCRSSFDADAAPYSTLITLWRAYHTCLVLTASYQTAASGMRTGAVKTSAGPFFCDRENQAFAASDEVHNVRFRDEIVILPPSVAVGTDSEILLDGETYEVESVFLRNGLRYCRCIVKGRT